MYRTDTLGNHRTATDPEVGRAVRPLRRRGRTRLWDELLTPRLPVNPKKPYNTLFALVDHFLHPVKAMRAQLARGPHWMDVPWRLWWALAFVAVAGSLIYGASLVLVLPAGEALYAALALAGSAGAAWILFGMVLLGITRQPAPHIAHACLVTMMFGEAVLELGVIANLTFSSALGALEVNVAIVALSNVAMLVVLIAQLRVLGVRPWVVTALWLVILNPAGVAVFRWFYPEAFPF